MPKNLLPPLSKKQQEALFIALDYMNMGEIKAFCNKHQISLAGKKGLIITRIKHFLLTGELLQPKPMPIISKAQAGKNYPLKTSTLILHGAYKNDLKTRLFFKKLIGKHFHFTAAGQDWIQQRWDNGKPPTYAEFAQAWQKEYERRTKTEANPRKEWAYLNFMLRYQKANPHASRTQMTAAWKKTRQEQADKAKAILNRIQL